MEGGGAQISWLNFLIEKVHGGGGDSVIEHYSKYTNPGERHFIIKIYAYLSRDYFSEEHKEMVASI